MTDYLDNHASVVRMILAYIDDWKKHGNTEAVKAVANGANMAMAEMVKSKEEFREFCQIWLSEEDFE